MRLGAILTLIGVLVWTALLSYAFWQVGAYTERKQTCPDTRCICPDVVKLKHDLLTHKRVSIQGEVWRAVWFKVEEH